ncbi:MAG: 1-deoxy-D-xylulose-5-phosphate synthase, partial [Candidatus Hydrothermae bacterium]|nr:1-deoxy-D-xylulose-5-phosphate synthase [Candidatus Hydrothermae bacterium]
LAVGTMVHPSLKAAERVERETGAKIAVVNARFVKPLDTGMLLELYEKGISSFITVEENALEGGFGTRVLAFLNARNLLKETKVLNIGLPDRFVTHGKREELLDLVGLSEDKLAEKIRGFLSSQKVTIHAL